jgi:hypothetical protein
MSDETRVRQLDAEPPENKPSEKPPDYDIVDSEEDLKCWPSLEPFLRYCKATVGKEFLAADSDAMNSQKWHKWLVLIAAVCGMLAVLFAITQLYCRALLDREGPCIQASHLIVHAEILAAFVALLAVGLGVGTAVFNQWLLKREQAERYRLLKFRFLIHPNLWNGAASGEWQEQLRKEIEDIKNLNREGLESWARGEGKVLEASSPAEAPVGVGRTVLEEVIGYYQKKRLTCQQEYCKRQANKRHFWGRPIRLVSHWLFLLSIMFALSHFLYDKLGGLSHAVSLTLIMFAACLPVVGAAARTLSAAHEFGRNTLRFEATSNELTRMASSLEDKDDPKAKLEILQVVERVLEVERREWLRLMKEAEWFG